MLEFFARLLDTSAFPPRWYCGEWSAGLGWLHIASDLASFFAFTLITMTLLWFSKNRRPEAPVPTVVWWCVATVFACGLVHLTEAIIFWMPVYRFSGLLKLVTASVACVTAFYIVRFAPLALQMPGLLAVNSQLESEINRRTETEQRLSAILNSMNAGVMVSDPSGNIETLNPAAMRIFNLDESKPDYSNLFRNYLFFTDGGKRLLAGDQFPLRQSAMGHRIDNLEVKVRCPSRFIEKTILWRSQPIFDWGNPSVITGAVGVFSDITEYKLLAREKGFQQERLERLTQSAAQVTNVLQQSTEGNESFVRVIAEKLDAACVILVLGCETGRFRWESYRFKRPDWELKEEPEIVWCEKEDVESIASEDLMNEAVCVAELKLGNRSWSNLVIAGLPLGGEIRGFIMVSDRRRKYSADDLDLLHRLARLASAAVFTRCQYQQESEARKVAESKLAASRKELERLTRVNSVGEMTAGIAHELNQPLTAMINFTDAADAAMAANHLDAAAIADIRNLIKRANEQAIRATRVLKSVRSMIRSEPSQFSNINLRQLIEGACQLLCEEIIQCDAKVVVEDVDPSLHLDADPTQIEQVLVNLIRNALESVTKCSTRLISISAIRDESHAAIRVADTGAGFLEEDCARLFDAFFTTRESGLGLGLKICRSIVESHGGQIRATNLDSGGACFIVTLPLKQIVSKQS
jgi:signal transduction histidine kinase/PAS domain-containing protein